jgi:hypothetical protein
MFGTYKLSLNTKRMMILRLVGPGLSTLRRSIRARY